MTYEQSRALLKAHQEATGKTQSAIAKELNISNSYVSQYLDGTHPNPGKYIEKVERLLQRHEKRKASKTAPPFVETTVSKRVLETIDYCHTLGTLSAVYGDAGVGKTMAAEEYKRRNPDSIVITTSPSFASKAAINGLLARELGVKERSSWQLYDGILEKLKGSHRCIIIDEAQHLTTHLIDHLRQLPDITGCGLCLIGNYKLSRLIYGKTGGDHDQIYSRAVCNYEAKRSALTLQDIRLVFAEANLKDDCAELLHKITTVTGFALRGAVRLFLDTIIGFNITDYDTVTVKHIAKMAQERKVIIGSEVA